jgi:two-component system cell cycle response regulator
MGEFIHGLGSRSGLLLLGVAALALNALTSNGALGDAQVHQTIGDWLYGTLVLAAGAACFARAVGRKAERPAWLAIGVALVCWGLGASSYALTDGSIDAFPVAGDAFALAFYPAILAALFFFASDRGRKVKGSVALDGSICALAMGAVGTAINFQVAGADTQSGTLAIAVEVAYQAGDVLLLGAVAMALAITGWSPGRAWMLAALGLAGLALGDLTHLHQSGAGFHPSGALLAAIWPTSALVVGYAALESLGRASGSRAYWRALVVPMSLALVAGALLVYNELNPIGAAAFALAVGSLAVAVVRPVLGFRENLSTLDRSQKEALTDALTGVSNRRKLMLDLREQIQASDASSPRILILFDLDGFKQYNDTYGHPAGDALLQRLGANLAKAVGPYGNVYRMGGDEFCVLLTVGMSSVRTLTSIAASALSERGEGFMIRSSYGAVMIPQEAREPARALKIADQRMYAQKERSRPSTGRQTRDILLQALRERDPELSEHMSAVGELSRKVGQRLKLLPEELDETVRAAELHDIGKMAIPDAILHKAGPLDENEWEFVHKHTIIGERILAAAPALVPVAKVVRSSHERWDGNGYPDGLAGDDILIGARIVAVCDAYHAMTTARPYGTTMAVEDALVEIGRAAGGEFDPRVVQALGEVVRETVGLPPAGIAPPSTPA